MIFDNTINSREQLMDAIVGTIKHFGGRSVWWRGQSRSEWDLKPAIYRRQDVLDVPEVERDLTTSFQRRALTKYPNPPAHDDLTSWLFLMQHYRLPTKLLDWSESPLVAAYFALSDDSSISGSLWALAPHLLNEAEFGERIICLSRGEYTSLMFAHSFNPEAVKNVNGITKIGAVFANEVDMRIVSQLSTFTIHGRHEPLNEVVDSDKYLIKYEISSEVKSKLSNFLSALGIRESSLFPDLEHLANEMAKGNYERI